MTDSQDKNELRAIPSVDEVLSQEWLTGHREKHPLFPWARLVRAVIGDYRAMQERPGGVNPADRESVRAWIVSEVERRYNELYVGGQKRVINGTGVILHTNLGRAVVGPGARDAVTEAMAHYVSLEVDLDSGRRSRRAETLNDLAALATGGEAAMVVNNNAAAVYLVVNSCSPPGRVIVSRGELVEIGGSFRLPEILRHAASEVIEIGTTNRTYAKDYENAARPGDLLLKVHKSNYAIKGFASEASYSELARIATEKNCFLAYDLGSGAVFDYGAAGIGQDPCVQEILEAGVDCITMSGDKLMGGVQAGLVVGKAAFMQKLRQNPLRRAVRIDKVSVAALQDVLRCYLFSSDPVAGIPVLAQALESVEAVRQRADVVADAVAKKIHGPVTVGAVDDNAAMGGGSWSSEVVHSAAVRLGCEGEREAVKLARRMRLNDPPVVPRVKGSEVRINMRSVMPYEDDELVEILVRILTADLGEQ